VPCSRGIARFFLPEAQRQVPPQLCATRSRNSAERRTAHARALVVFGAAISAPAIVRCDWMRRLPLRRCARRRLALVGTVTPD
jgi:hypothetical protein